jgi:hypothetical protein
MASVPPDYSRDLNAEKKWDGTGDRPSINELR